MATTNIGATSALDVVGERSDPALPVTIFICETDPATGQCVSPVAERLTTSASAGGVQAFGVFVVARESVAQDLAAHRVSLVFRDLAGGVRGRTSVAVTTE